MFARISAFALSAVTLAALSTPASAGIFSRGCKADCEGGSCSTSNKAKECGCCADGTPFCGNSNDCGDKLVGHAAGDLIEAGGGAAIVAWSDAIVSGVEPTPERDELVGALHMLADAYQAGDQAGEQAALVMIDYTFAELQPHHADQVLIFGDDVLTTLGQ